MGKKYQSILFGCLIALGAPFAYAYDDTIKTANAGSAPHHFESPAGDYSCDSEDYCIYYIIAGSNSGNNESGVKLSTQEIISGSVLDNRPVDLNETRDDAKSFGNISRYTIMQQLFKNKIHVNYTYKVTAINNVPLSKPCEIHMDEMTPGKDSVFIRQGENNTYSCEIIHGLGIARAFDNG